MASLVSLLTQVFSPSAAPATVSVRTVSSNPYNNNPFMSYNGNSLDSYAKNTPVRGGYFAGYYNGKQNIVGQRLFIEV